MEGLAYLGANLRPLLISSSSLHRPAELLTVGPLTGDPQCRRSILRNVIIFPTFHVDFKMVSCCMAFKNTNWYIPIEIFDLTYGLFHLL